MTIPREATYGERRVGTLLQDIEKHQRESFFSQSEYRIFHANVRPDFIAVLATHGVAVIEVKDWVKIIDGTQEKISIHMRDGAEKTLPNPYITAEDYCYALKNELEQRDELLSARRGRKVLSFPWQPVVILSNVSNKVIREMEKANIFPENTVFGKETLKDPTTLFHAIRNLPWRFKLKRPLGSQTLNTLRGVLNPYAKVDLAGEDRGTATYQQETLILEPLPSAELQQMSFLEDDPLSSEANQVVNNLTIRLVRGVAGSGKTLVILKRAQYLRERYPHSRVLVLTFNTDLVKYLQKRAPGLEITNFHKLCSDIIGKKWHSPLKPRGWLEKYAMPRIRQIGLPYTDDYDLVSYVKEEIAWRKDLELFGTQEYLNVERRGRALALTEEKRRLLDEIFQDYWQHQIQQRKQNQDWMDWEDVPYVALDMLTQGALQYQNYDTILVDEGQDFAPVWMRVITNLLKRDGSLFLCDDPTQSLFRYFSWRQKGVDVVGRTRVLKVPFRCSRQINEASYSLIATDPILSRNDEITHPDLKSPELLDGKQPILYSFSSLEHERETIVNEVDRLISDGMDPYEIAVLCHSKRFVKYYAPLRDVGVYVDTFDKMKGLEFMAVFIPEITTAFDRDMDDETLSQVRRRIFTAMTRARYILVLSHQTNEPIPLALGSILPHVWREAL